MGIGSTARSHAGTGAVHARRYVVHKSVRHAVIDVLPREPVTFRAACGQDVVEGETLSGEPTDCTTCLRFERTWFLVKSTEVI